ncbi:MAG: DNA mismatch repair protein [Spirochaetales bacterium]|nr:DNA mismatch repair protein [Spirochaetales bacterium]
MTVAQALSKYKMYQGVIVEDSSNIGEKEYSGKGSFGQYLEEVFFGITNNSESKPDFIDAGLELKTAPLKELKNGELAVKERIVLGIINFDSIIEETFEKSHFLEKNLHILLVFYVYDKLAALENIQVNLVDIWNCVEQDETQIKKDWETIVGKIRRGKAHEISEGDTLYLGACTKGATRATSQVPQPFSDILAHRRAFSFKIQYVRYIYQSLMEKRQASVKRKKIADTIRITQNRTESIDQIIKEAFCRHKGKDAFTICKDLGLPYNPKAKHFYAQIVKRILGADANQRLYEFEAAGIQIKTVRIEVNGKNKESMSFKHMRYTEIVEQDWEDSDFYVDLTSKFLFIVFRRNPQNEGYFLDDVIFWNMPAEDLEEARKVWIDTQQKIQAGNYNSFVKIKDDRIVHVRPHARNAADKIITPQKTMELKRSFWLNRDYILNIVENKSYLT